MERDSVQDAGNEVFGNVCQRGIDLRPFRFATKHAQTQRIDELELMEV